MDQLTAIAGVKRACQALAVPRASWYRRRRCQRSPRAVPSSEKGQRHSARALSESEQSTVLACLHEERFQDCSPAQVYAALLDQGRYHCSIRTMYRLLEAGGESRERRDQLTHPPYQKPELLATEANQLWSWDITKLRGPVKWTAYHLYVILDVFSRYVVGWMIAYRESAVLAKRLIEHTCLKQNIAPGQLTVHCAGSRVHVCSRYASITSIDFRRASIASTPGAGDHSCVMIPSNPVEAIVCARKR